MAVDKLVDSTQLDSDLTSVANAIRAKSGGSSQLAFPAGFVSEIGNISGGGINGTNISSGTFYVGGYTGGTANVVSGDININFPGVTLKIDHLFDEATKASGVTSAKLTINCNWISSASALCFRSKAITEIEVHFTDPTWGLPPGTQFCQATSASNTTSCAVKKIIGQPISMSSNTSGSYSMFKYNSVIEDVTFLENSAGQAVDFPHCSSFTNTTLVSLANCLKSGSYTLTLHATPKARLSSIMGTISQKTKSGVTYDFFTVDENGTVSLQSFITSTKGWTLA